MAVSAPFDFTNDSGRHLSGVLQDGDGGSRAYAVFAHCFTCDKASHAATRISRALAERGVGVLRFDFTGLGQSEGEFGRGLTGDVDDIVRACAAMTEAGMTPTLLIGHSFGGAAVLAAAHFLADVTAVVVIGAPFDADHVLEHLGDGLEGVTDDRRVPIKISGRSFSLGRAFVEDIKAQPQEKRITELGRALLILHSPLDQIVSIDNASKIFLAARHPKSFVSLDKADHLLVDKVDAGYAAGVIAAWSVRYLKLADVADAAPVHGIRVEETGAGKFQVRVKAATSSFLVDEPLSVGGLGYAPTPYDLLCAGLGACTAMTCRLYADRKGWPLDRAIVEVGHTGRTSTKLDHFVRKLGFEGALNGFQRARLLEVVERCPVHETLTNGATIMTERLEPGQPDEGPPDNPEDHVWQMEQTCENADRIVDEVS